MRGRRGLGSAFRIRPAGGYSSSLPKVNVSTGYFVRFTCCPPLVAILNCKAGVLRESLRIRVRLSDERLNRRCATLRRYIRVQSEGSDLLLMRFAFQVFPHSLHYKQRQVPTKTEANTY